MMRRKMAKQIKKNRMSSGEELKKALIGSEEKFNLLMELATDGVIVVQDGKIKEVNYFMARLCGYTIDEVLDTDFASFFHPHDIPTIEIIYKSPSADANTVAVHELTLMCKNGHNVEVEIIAGQFSYHNNPAILLIVRDISDRSKTEGMLERARQFDAIAALSGGIAHDYNNLLTAIIGNISLAQSYLNPDDKVYLLLKQALSASKTAKDLTQKLITFSKGGAPDKKMADVAKLIKSAAEFTLSGSNIKSEFHFPNHLWPVEVDKRQIGQAVHSLVMNARESMPDGGDLRVDAENMKTADRPPHLKKGNYVRISIADRGTGIAKKNLDKIFDPYFSTKKRGTKKGTGLGLSISQSIIKKHGGDVTVESRVGQGTTFHIYLPSANGKNHAQQAATPAELEIPLFGEGRILVMDDEEMIRKLAAEILTYLGYEVDFAANGAEAVDRYKQAMAAGKPFDAVILDLTVKGGVGGKAAIQKLVKIDPHVIGIISSGYTNDPGITDFGQYGFSGVVAKPYTMGELGEKLNHVLSQRKNK
jgi:PAS domain S-box-containing protein